MLSTTFITALVALVTTASAHMEMKWPPALSSRYNGFTVTQDNNNHAPLSPDGSNFPCRSHLSDLGTPAGASVVTWNAGAEYNFTITGAIDAPNSPAFHNGGSCQAALSYDGGKTWKVIHSYQGACPTSTGGAFKFNVPSDAKAGGAVFAWLWWNHTGNREMYMNCASVTIADGSGPAPAVPFANRPDIFKANIGNGCKTADEVDVFFPSPGPDVTTVGTKKENTYTGNCGSAAPAGDVGPPSAPVQSPTPTTAPAQGPGSVSTNGECGGTTTCMGSAFGNCCSKWGWCGSTADYCSDDAGCMSGFGTCGGVSSRSAAIRGRHFLI
ncbi:hypothetical protein DL95DRAFT_301065 [Leptodontidium sp. 2 PMI_412]|nr:hypothetical protein DL95DRAFT_301065 [Leptodontidium sp. 2 PMI_412]